ncbi:DUF1097 domain-containing protein [Marinobacterium rhizophilum]|uniref:DUF1097 domain-containing protein n=1 Tax=Marinobacterium rhizophilum TaxID=420402 RepID=UPI00036133E5|nr:DUF1097 domain-containing protein [Marinobacterium rhizophilum]
MVAIYAYALTGAVIASLATWAFLSYPGLLIWSAFIGWAGFLHSGGGKDVVRSVLTSMYFGAFMAWLFALLITGGNFQIPLPVSAAVIVAVMAPIMIIASKMSLLSVVPATFYGFACSFAYLAQTPGMFTFEALTTVTISNVIFVVPFSLTIGVLLGSLQVFMSTVLTSAPE